MSLLRIEQRDVQIGRRENSLDLREKGSVTLPAERTTSLVGSVNDLQHSSGRGAQWLKKPVCARTVLIAAKVFGICLDGSHGSVFLCKNVTSGASPY
jgi:hypothetical protein